MNHSSFPVPAARPPRVEIIPLIDVVFFLLATFVLFTLSLHKIRSLDVNLPRTDLAGEDGGTVFLQATAGDVCFWKEGARGSAELITAAELPGRLRDYARRAAPPRVFIRSDHSARLGPAVALLDQVRQAGIRQVSIETTASRPGT